MAKQKKENWYIIGAAVAAWALWAWYQKRKMQPQNKPANLRFQNTGVDTQTIELLADNVPTPQQKQKPEFPYIVEVKSISGLKLM